MKGTVTRLYTPDNPALLPAICGPQHRNLMKLEMALIDGKLAASFTDKLPNLAGSLLFRTLPPNVAGTRKTQASSPIHPTRQGLEHLEIEIKR